MAMLWVKAFHIITMVAWFAGIFYLPRLFVYHADVSHLDSVNYRRFCTMEKRLFWGIMTPSALLTLLLGVGLVHFLHLSFYGLPFWLAIKLVLVGALLLFHGYCGIIVYRFRKQTNKCSSLYYRWINEFPVILLVGIVLLAVLKPH